MNERLGELAKEFFDRVLRLCPQREIADYVVVTHLLEDRPWFLRAISGLGRIVAVIPKRKSLVPRVRDVIRHQFPLLDIARSELETREGITQNILPLQRDKPLCLLDVGGYFSFLTSMDLAQLNLLIAGVVEDTENGHVKYEKALDSGRCQVPIYSVARSQLKAPENFLVGQSLVFSVDALLRQRDELLHGRRACVVGYGHIGRSVAHHLHERHVDVTVFDNDPMKLVEAFTHGFRTPETLREALSDAELVFCVTGNHSLGAKELSYLRPFTYVATVTSPDDELALDGVNVSISHRHGHISELHSADGKTIYLMNRGQAVNFVHGSVVGPFIQLLQAEILVAASTMLSENEGGHSQAARSIGSVSRAQKNQIANTWLEVYRH